MITYKIKEYSHISKATEALDKEKIYDYCVTDKVTKDEVSIKGDLGSLEIWIPQDYEFSQYAIDDCIREMLPYAYTNTKNEGKFFHMIIKGRLNQAQYNKLLKKIIEETEYVNIVE